MALSRSKIIHHASHSVISYNACARARNAPTFSATLRDVCFLFMKRNNAIFRWYFSCHPVVCTIMSILWAYFIIMENEGRFMVEYFDVVENMTN